MSATLDRPRTITPVRVVGIAIALLWPFVIRPAVHLAPISPILRTELQDVVVLLSILFVLKMERIKLKDIGLRWPSWKDALWAIGIALIGLLLSGTIQQLFPTTEKSLANALGNINFLVAIPFVLIVALAEELTFRGYLIGVFASNIGTVLAFIISTLVFGFAHASTFGLNGVLLAPFVIGALLAGFYTWRRNLTACVLGHALIDYVGVVLLASAQHLP